MRNPEREGINNMASKIHSASENTIDPMNFVYDVLARVAGVSVFAFVLSYVFGGFAKAVDWVNAPSDFTGYALLVLGVVAFRDLWHYAGERLDLRDLNAVAEHAITAASTLAMFWVFTNWPW